ncbi:hypothetical protein ACFX15_001591 [Malus domestica]
MECVGVVQFKANGKNRGDDDVMWVPADYNRIRFTSTQSLATKQTPKFQVDLLCLRGYTNPNSSANVSILSRFIGRAFHGAVPAVPASALQAISTSHHVPRPPVAKRDPPLPLHYFTFHSIHN